METTSIGFSLFGPVKVEARKSFLLTESFLLLKKEKYGTLSMHNSLDWPLINQF